MASNDDFHSYSNIKYGVDTRGILFFTGLRDDGRTVRISMRDALYNGIPTEDGIELSPGWILPYGEVDVYHLARDLYTGDRLLKTLRAAEARGKTFVIFANSIFQREWLQGYPDLPVSRISQYGLQIMWHVQGEKHEFVHDYRAPFGELPKVDAVYERFMKIFSYEVFNRSDQVVYVEGKLQLFESYREANNALADKNSVHIKIDSARWFKDTPMYIYPKRRFRK